MTDSDATLLAAIIAAIVAGGGLVWSIIGFAITRRSQRATDARAQWSQRFEQAHTLALSADEREARTGLMLIEALTKEHWVTDEDRATAVSVLASLAPTHGAESDRVRAGILADMGNRQIAAELAEVSPGPKGRFEISRDDDGAHRWRLRSPDGEVLAVSEAASTRTAALRSLEQARRALGGGGAVAIPEN